MSQPLQLICLPGPHGPVLRCTGRLDQHTADLLWRAAALLVPLRHRALLLDIRGLDYLDCDGLAVLQDLTHACRRTRVRLVLVVGTGPLAELFSVLGLARNLPTAASEEKANEMLTFLLGERQWPERSWDEARERSLERWRRLSRDLEVLAPEDAARELTAMHPLCERSEDVLRLEGEPGMTRCEFCPLFRALGGTDADLGCDRVLNPILEALSRSDLPAARAGIERVIAVLEQRAGVPAKGGVPETPPDSDLEGCEALALQLGIDVPPEDRGALSQDGYPGA